LEGGKVGEGWKGIDEGCGKWVEPADLPTPQANEKVNKGIMYKEARFLQIMRCISKDIQKHYIQNVFDKLDCW